MKKRFSRRRFLGTTAALGAGPRPWANFDYASALNEFLMLGNVATQFEETLEFDPVAMKIVNNAEADGLLRSEYREGWRLGLAVRNPGCWQPGMNSEQRDHGIGCAVAGGQSAHTFPLSDSLPTFFGQTLGCWRGISPDVAKHAAFQKTFGPVHVKHACGCFADWSSRLDDDAVQSKMTDIAGHCPQSVRARALASRIRCSSFMKWSSSDNSSDASPAVFSLWIRSAT